MTPFPLVGPRAPRSQQHVTLQRPHPEPLGPAVSVTVIDWPFLHPGGQCCGNGVSKLLTEGALEQVGSEAAGGRGVFPLYTAGPAVPPAPGAGGGWLGLWPVRSCAPSKTQDPCLLGTGPT